MPVASAEWLPVFCLAAAESAHDHFLCRFLRRPQTRAGSLRPSGDCSIVLRISAEASRSGSCSSFVATNWRPPRSVSSLARTRPFQEAACREISARSAPPPACAECGLALSSAICLDLETWHRAKANAELHLAQPVKQLTQTILPLYV